MSEDQTASLHVACTPEEKRLYMRVASLKPEKIGELTRRALHAEVTRTIQSYIDQGGSPKDWMIDYLKTCKTSDSET